MKVGEVLLGKYRVERILGRGGMGQVVAATHLRLNTTVAIKFLLPELKLTEEMLQRFLREARAAASIESEHVSRVLDVGTLDGDVPYMVLEYLQGADLSATLSKRGPLPVKEAIDYLLQACEAVAEAHRRGIIHRDLKPANLFLAQRADGSSIIKVLDFGISKVAVSQSKGGVELTATSDVMGSPYYMSPEQLRSSAKVGPATDLWSLGVILFQFLAGEVPFGGKSITDVLVGVLNRPAPSLHSFRKDVPPQVDDAVRRCLEKEERDRYSNVAELSLALKPYGPKRRAARSVERILRVQHSMGSPQQRVQEQVPAACATNLEVVSTAALEGAPRRRRSLWIVPAGILAGCAVVIAIAVQVARRPSQPPLALSDSAAVPASSILLAAPVVSSAVPSASAQVATEMAVDGGTKSATTGGAVPPTVRRPPSSSVETANPVHTSVPAPTPSAVVPPEPRKNPLNVNLK